MDHQALQRAFDQLMVARRQLVEQMARTAAACGAPPVLVESLRLVCKHSGERLLVDLRAEVERYGVQQAGIARLLDQLKTITDRAT